jgi:hypothetical protein
MDPITHFPAEISFQILSPLPSQDLGRCCQVSKAWNSVANDDLLWKHLFQNIPIPSGMNIKKYVQERSVRSKDELLKRIQRFANQITVDKEGRFTCLFPWNPGCSISADFYWENNHSKGNPEVRETCIFIKTILPQGQDPKIYSSERSTLPYYPDFPSAFIFYRTVSPKARLQVRLPPRNDLKNEKLCDQISNICKDRLLTLEMIGAAKLHGQFFLLGCLFALIFLYHLPTSILRGDSGDSQ